MGCFIRLRDVEKADLASEAKKKELQEREESAWGNVLE